MREILFRGKRVDNGEWIEGYFIPALEKDRCSIYDIEHPELGYYVDPDTVGECTGLTDKNGKLIFEGDIVKVERDLLCGENKKEREIFNGVVWYDEKHTCFGLKSERYRCLPIYRFKGDYSTAIGNIHDNPELLKGGEG